MTQKGKTIFPWFRILCVYLLLLLIIEWLGRAYIYHRESIAVSGFMGDLILNENEPLIGFGLKKNAHADLGKFKVETNDLGFRDAAFSVKKPENEIRIFVVGGSTVFGWGENSSNAIAARLQEKLKKANPSNKRVRVINAGIPWYTSAHEVAMIFFKIMEMEPDAVYVVDGLNDLVSSLSAKWSPIHLGYMDRATRIAFERRNEAKEGRGIINYMFSQSLTLQYLISRLREETQQEVALYHPELWTQYLSQMGRIHEVLQSENIDFGVFLQPVMSLQKDVNYYEEHADRGPFKDEKIKRLFVRMYEEGEARLQEEATFPFYSLKSIFRDLPNHTTVYIDGIHYTATGNNIIAEALFEKRALSFLREKLSKSSDQKSTI